MEDTEEVVMTRAEFDAALSKDGEYSCSLPSGTTIGKKWFRNNDAYSPIRQIEKKLGDPAFPDWWQGEYYELDPPVPNRVGIKWRKVRLKE